MTNMIRSERPQEEPTPRFNSTYLFTGALIGLILGLFLSLAFFRVRWVDITPKQLTDEAQKDYVSAIALAYYAENDLGRARARLEEIEPDTTLPLFVNGFGSQIRSEDAGPSLRVLTLYWLASDLSGGTLEIVGLEEWMEQQSPSEEEAAPEEEAEPESSVQEPVASAEQPQTPTTEPTAEELAMQEEIPIAEVLTPPDETSAVIVLNEQPFQLAERLNFCDQALAQQLQVEVLNEDGVPLAGVQVFLQWGDGNETLFTGLYPEISSGYADYAMAGDVVYQLRVGEVSLFIEDIAVSQCQLADGTTYLGGVWLQFQAESSDPS
jgi:hypothetical protein